MCNPARQPMPRICTSQAGEGRDCNHCDANQEGGRRHAERGGVRQRDQDHQDGKDDEDHCGAESGFSRQSAHIVLEWHMWRSYVPMGQELGHLVQRCPGVCRVVGDEIVNMVVLLRRMIARRPTSLALLQTTGASCAAMCRATLDRRLWDCAVSLPISGGLKRNLTRPQVDNSTATAGGPLDGRIMTALLPRGGNCDYGSKLLQQGDCAAPRAVVDALHLHLQRPGDTPADRWPGPLPRRRQ